MSEPSITISLEQLLPAEKILQFVRDTLVDAITPEARDKMVADAVAGLLKPPAYGRAPEMMEIINRCMRDQAYKIVEAELSKPERQEEIRVLFQEAWEKRMSGEQREKLVSKLSDAIVYAAVDR